MNVFEAKRVLRDFQKWRRGADMDMPNPRVVGEAIDFALRVLRVKSREHGGEEK